MKEYVFTPAGPFDEDKFLEGELAAFLQNYDKEYDDDAAVSDVAIHFYELGKKMKQKPAESDVIKGGDFISDGKRVFLVLANVKERNLGETGSTFCEGHILGVDGVVYCNGDNFKKFKRATSNERAKFIHDLKVGVELKEQPVEWSEEDEHYFQNLIMAVDSTFSDGNTKNWLQNRLKSLRPQPRKEQPVLPGIEDPGIPGRDFIPVEWVDACEMYGKWKIVKQEQPDIIDYICLCAGIPAPFMDGNQWCILKGDNIQVGVVGFGDTKDDALIDFIKDIPLQHEPAKGIDGVVHHYLNTHWIVTDKKQLATALKVFPEGAEVELFIFAKKEGAK